jgi:hypothetical protein
MITISQDTSGRMRVTFPYSQEVVAKIKTIETRRWHTEGKYWSFQHSKPVLDEILSTLAFLSHLAVDLKVSASTQNQAFNALLLLYREVLGKELGESINAVRAKKPQYLPTVMTKDETMRVIAAVPPDS